MKVLYLEILGPRSVLSRNDSYCLLMKGKNFKKEDYVLMAKLAQQTERFEEMITFADQILSS